MPNPLLARYTAGERREVWRDLVALGAAVRHELYYKDAVAVAAETMKRGRHNVETIVEKLEKLGYQFSSGADEFHDLDQHLANAERVIREKVSPEPRNAHEAAMANMFENIKSLQQQMAARAPQLAEVRSRMEQRRKQFQSRPALENPDVFAPPDRNTARQLNRFEKALHGPMPLSLRSWYEHVGTVNLMGSHEALNPSHGPCAPDPLVVYPFLESAESDYGKDLEFEGEAMELALAPDDLHKANTSGGGPYAMTVPNAAADGAFLGESHRVTFVEYLRLTFEWGGFPGWQGREDCPRKEIDFLCEGLLPL